MAINATSARAPKGGVIGQINRKLAEQNRTAETEQKPILVQGELPGQETPKLKDVIRAAEAYREARDERMKLTMTEVERKEFLHNLMNSHGLKYYSYEGLTVEIVAGRENVKVRVEADDEEDED